MVGKMVCFFFFFLFLFPLLFFSSFPPSSFIFPHLFSSFFFKIPFPFPSPPSLKESIIRFYMANILLGLQYLHSCKVIHRDIKPPNILLDENGYASLTDFNIAAQLGLKGEREREGERGKEREREGERGREREREGERGREREREGKRGKERERGREGEIKGK